MSEQQTLSEDNISGMKYLRDELLKLLERTKRKVVLLEKVLHEGQIQALQSLRNPGSTDGVHDAYGVRTAHEIAEKAWWPGFKEALSQPLAEGQAFRVRLEHKLEVVAQVISLEGEIPLLPIREIYRGVFSFGDLPEPAQPDPSSATTVEKEPGAL